MTEYSDAPSWFPYILTKCPKGTPHWRIKVREADEEHDGYCSGASDCLEVRSWKTKTYFLPIHENDSEITWKGKDLVRVMKFDLGKGSGTESCPAGGSGYCGARKRIEILAIARITGSKSS